MSETKLNPSGRDDYIRLLSGEGYSSELIRKTLKKYQINTSKAKISRVLNKVTKNSKKNRWNCCFAVQTTAIASANQKQH